MAPSAGEALSGLASLPLERLRALRVLRDAGVIRPMRPDRVLDAATGLAGWGFTLPGAYAALAALEPRRTAAIDELGATTFAELDSRANAIANGLADHGVRAGDGVGVLCRNHRGVIEASLAIGKLGANVLFLNTGFAAPQLREVLQRESASALVHDAEFDDIARLALPVRRRFIAWNGPGSPRAARLETFVAKYDAEEPAPPSRPGRITLLTSGTTGTPRGAARSQLGTLGGGVALLSRIPLRARETTLIASPLFHAWGAAHLGLGLMLSSTLVLLRRFDPEAALAAVEEHNVTAIACVPLMLQRILDLPRSQRRRYDTSSLRVVAVSGSALSPSLAERFMDAYGDIVYNLYGSTEVAWATIATPQDLREAPGTTGKPPLGTTVRVLNESGDDVATGETGRIFVGNDMMFEGYTGGGTKDMVDGLMASGDVGHLDAEGRLFVEGRDDEMIVSGGENVFPVEVEELLAAHDAVAEVAVVGVSDDEWGQRLRAYVVTRGGARLTEDDVRAYVRSRLARYKVPRDVVIVKSLPRNAAGKVVKRELPEPESAAAGERSNGGRRRQRV